MPLSEIILIIMGLLTVAMLAAGICRNIPIPYTVFLVIVGVCFGALARSEHHFHFLMEFQLTPELVLFLFLPALIFESAFNLDSRKLLKDLGTSAGIGDPCVIDLYFCHWSRFILFAEYRFCVGSVIWRPDFSH